ncbi:DegQ family serine endoprotease [Jeongeupia naejangsanensis]|uniref:Probable periplasmic serine endoprotease DegP-like n=1 Tax=Jeongeupia naejangsanensis TaxID=613195 RepID=A0ABS2BJT2_9NEIS|nr:DegQ family serine endoprotease [Jeongeupia naejangsanensis]MBM3115251.1 DegQ family serine endoprotease [Jeongeupia naejangsanensis]
MQQTQAKTWWPKLSALVVAAALGGAVGAISSRALPVAAAAPSAPLVAAQASPTLPAPAAAGLPSFNDIVTRYGPAVVNISTTGMTKTADVQQGAPALDPNDPFYEFFRRFGVPMQPQRPQVTRGLGSGFIVGSDGLILTNAHVVDGASEVTVKLTDKREFKAKVIGVDKPTDVAVLRIDAKDLPTVKLGDPAASRVGDWVLAIGSPYGFENSVTAGIVSAKSRSLPDESYVPFIQTDVAINPGNSGGPLFNAAGEVIAINSQIYSRSGGFQGLSFSIPIDVVKQVEQQILTHGKVVRGQLGVMVQNVDQSLADSFGLKSPNGALISGVNPGGSGAKAGLKPGDIVLKFGDTQIASSGDLPPLVANVKPGETVPMTIWRDGKEKVLPVKIDAVKDAKVAQAPQDQGQAKLGLSVRPLTAQEKTESGIGSGLVVGQASGPAAKAGIQAGDVVLALNGTPVNSVEQLRSLAAKAGKHVALLVQRDDAQIFVPLDLG